MNVYDHYDDNLTIEEDDLQTELTKEIEKAHETLNKQKKRIRTLLVVIEILLTLGGMALLLFQDWKIALGMYMILYANNLGIFRFISRKGIEKFKIIWKQ